MSRYKDIMKKRAKQREIESKMPELHESVKRTRDVRSARIAKNIMRKRNEDLAEIDKKVGSYLEKNIMPIDKQLNEKSLKYTKLAEKVYRSQPNNKFLLDELGTLENREIAKMRDELIEADPEYKELMKKRDKLFNSKENLKNRQKQLELNQQIAKSQGIEAKGTQVGDRFAKWRRENFTNKEMGERYLTEKGLELEGLAPESSLVKTSKGDIIVQKAMYPSNYTPPAGQRMADGDIRNRLEKAVESKTPYLPSDLHGGNIGKDPQTGKPKIIDAGEFELKSTFDERNWEYIPEESIEKERDFLRRSRKAVEKSTITKSNAGKIRRKLPSVLPFVGPAILGASLLASPDANARNEVITDFADPLGSEVIGGGDLPKAELVKRDNFNRAMKLQNMRKGVENEYRNNAGEPTNTNPLY